MLINDLELLEEVSQEDQIQGGIQLGSVSTATAQGVNTDPDVNMNVAASSGGSASSGGYSYYPWGGYYRSEPSVSSSAFGSVNFYPRYSPY